ncbi:MAG: hypothetical protein IKV03_03700 [Alphaproteobacteria bacterium]|nr:hypothetical protein [Alphaproteobacteria bacterium]
MATQKKAKKTVEALAQCDTKGKYSDLLTRIVLVFETAVLYFIILFIIFVANNFTVMFFPKG